MQKVSNGHRITFIWEYGEALVAQRKQSKEVQDKLQPERETRHQIERTKIK